MTKSAASSPSRRPIRSGRAFFFAALPLLAVALGGSTARWSEGIVLALTGLSLLAVPPRSSLGTGINGVLAGLLALTATAFLPAAWFHLPAWRAALTDDLGTVLPATLAPQPWLSAEGIALFASGMCWFYLVSTVAWTSDERPRAGRWFAGGVVGLAAVFIVCRRLHLNPPIWHTERGFGPFPNRNQTADFLAVGALPVLACAHLAWRGGRRGAAAAWLVGWVVVVAALFQGFSRAGIGILFAGTAVYLGNEIVRALRRPAKTDTRQPVAPKLGSWRTPALAASLVLLLASGFMLFGGDTLQRLHPGRGPTPVTADNAASVADFRVYIQRDALDLIADSPWCGNGVGAFEGVFPPYRVRSAVNLHVVHPESDWLWLTAELGWPAFALALAGVALLVRRMWPQRPGTDRPLRAAAAWGAALFALHGFVDVSAHRVGTVWCGLFLVGLALPGVGEGRDFRRAAGWTAPVFRLLGLALLGVGTLWIAADRGRVHPPGAQEAARLLAAARAEASAGQWRESVAAATRSLALDPLDWRLYLLRAMGRVITGEDPAAAQADFRRTLYLEPFSGAVAETVAVTWARAGESDLAVSALLEASRRVPANAREYFNAVVAAAGNDPSFVDRLAAATRGEPVLQLLFLETLPLASQGPAAARIVEADPELRRFDPRQRTRLFCFWANDAPSLIAAMESHPAWQALGWRCWARACAATGQMERACRIAAQFAPKPVVPSEASAAQRLTIPELRAAAVQSPADAGAALRLARAQAAAGDKAGVWTTLHAAAARPDGPAYLRYLEAVAAAEVGRWTEGWEAWARYLQTVPGEG